ncbi:MAG TPA: ATP-binding protein [Ramlibacter sp.]|jgi:signal transduction histidine kinase/ActR/RegA family two-component response regulator|uniref:hybrid sensor histidine kinase/response regulator n=1 Tax=Ramlibacter sp. TaxID=1917967 RepID=UPI002D735FFD|nr:ATP-binding protein [Ramlibacter sp.]HZY17879.1 ATP-binding protein [Ramlibacter sp.]
MPRPARPLRPPRLRSRLLLLAAGSLVPVLALAWVLSWFILQHERENYRAVAQARNRTFLAAVDAKLQGHIATLRALAASEQLEAEDLRGFAVQARRVLATQPDWLNIILLDVQGQQLVNMNRSGAAPLPQARPEELPFIQRVVATGQPAVGNISRGPLGARLGIPVRIAVPHRSGPPWVLQFVLQPQALVPLMSLQEYPSSWAFGLVDANSNFIARVPEAPLPGRASVRLQEAIRSGAEGWYRGQTLEGRDTYTAHMTSTFTGWSVGVAIPTAEVHSAAWRAAAWTTAGTLLSLLLALGFASWLAGRIAEPIARLARAARGLGHRRLAEDLAGVQASAPVAEVRAVAAALAEADEALAERESLRRREREALRAADKAKDEFLAMLGHELRNPLSAITASAHVLRLSSPGAADATRAHEVIERQARQMTRLVEDLMDVSRLAMGKVTLQLERLDLGALAERVVQTWQQAGRSRAGRVRVDASTAWVEGDRARLEQVLANLLDNANKFSPAGALVEVRVWPDDGHAVLQVRDHGHGILPQDLPHIFELFVQGEQRVDRPHGGIGLGLSLVRRLVELQHGQVNAASEGAGQGACFTVHLPLAAAPDHPAVGATPPSARAEGRRVLLVEDNEDGRQMLEALLELEGHEVRSAPAGLPAVQLARDWPPDIALVDIGLPDIDGYEVARRLRGLALPRPLRLVALTGFGQPQDQRTAYEAGFDLHLTKPVAPEFLRGVLNALTAREAPPA